MGRLQKLKTARSAVFLIITALIWGVAFVAQSVATELIGPFTFNGTRCLIGGIILLPVIAYSDAKKKREGAYVKMTSNDWRTLLIGGVLCGICLCVASNLQQLGINDNEAGKAGFITALYIVIVPIIGIFTKKKVRPIIWICVAVAMVGMYFLCVSESFAFSKSDAFLFAGAFVFSLHIIVIDRFSPLTDGIKLSCIQFFVCAFISLIGMFIFEKPHIDDITAAYIPLLYAGIMSCGVAYTLQIIGQKGLNPTVASLILSLESVFSALAGWAILNETLSAKELFGCALIFAAIITAQIPFKRREKAKSLRNPNDV